MSDYKLPNGLLTAALTPQDDKLNVDYSRLVKHIKWLLNRGNDGIGLLGTTGEANSFSVHERVQILEAVLEGGVPPGKLLVGTGCCSITDTALLSRHAHTQGAGGILLLPPFYYKQITGAGLETYFEMLLDKIGEDAIEIYLYHFPQLTGIPFTTGLVQTLVSKYPKNIVGMKDSGGDWLHMEQILKEIPGFRLYAGNEKFLLPVLRAGGVGCISATANITSPEVAAVYDAWKKQGGEMEQTRATALREVLETYHSIGTLKYLFAKLTGEKDWLNIRPPNVIITSEEGRLLEQKLKGLDFIFLNH